MKRNFRILLLLMLINVQSSNTVMINGNGITTEKGFFSWEKLNTMSDRLDSIEKFQRIFFFGTVVCAGVFIYLKWFDNQTEQKIISDLDDIEN